MEVTNKKEDWTSSHNAGPGFFVQTPFVPVHVSGTIQQLATPAVALNFMPAAGTLLETTRSSTESQVLTHSLIDPHLQSGPLGADENTIIVACIMVTAPQRHNPQLVDTSHLIYETHGHEANHIITTGKGHT